MEKLKGATRRYLRGLANPIQPVIFIGKNGLNDQVITAIDEALEAHELIKIRFVEFKEQKKQLCAQIEEKCNCEWVGLIGHIGIFYRQNKDANKRKIQLPE